MRLKFFRRHKFARLCECRNFSGVAIFVACAAPIERHRIKMISNANLFVIALGYKLPIGRCCRPRFGATAPNLGLHTRCERAGVGGLSPWISSCVSSKQRANGGVAEWLKALAWKACIRETVSWVRIPPPPPRTKILVLYHVIVFSFVRIPSRFPGLCATLATTLFTQRRIRPTSKALAARESHLRILVVRESLAEP